MNHEHLVDERPRWSWSGAGVVLALSFLSYITVLLWGGWIWDDPDYVLRNPLLRLPDGLASIWFDTSATPQYYPLVHTSFRWEFQTLLSLGFVDPDNPMSPDPDLLPAFLFHLNNVILFALTALVFWKVLLRLRLRGALVAVLLFAVHPVNVESVAWVTERKNMLSGLLGMLTVLAFLRFARIGDDEAEEAAQADDAQARRLPLRWGWFATCFVFWAGALLSKTVVAFVPPALFLILWWKRPRDFIRWEHLVALGVMLIPGVIAGLHTAHLEEVQVGAGDNLFPEIDGMLDRILLAGTVVWVYFKHLVFPYQQVFFYHKWDPDPGVWWQWVLLLTAAGLPILLWLKRRDWGRGPCVAVLIFGGALFPVMGFANVFPMRFSWVADHFQYHASFSMFALFGALLARLRLPRLQGRVALGGLLALFVVLSNWHGIAFQSPETLWRKTLKDNDTVSLVWENLGVELVRQASKLEQAGEMEEAQALYDEAYGYYQEALERAQGPHIFLSLCQWHLREFIAKRNPEDLQQVAHYARRGLDEWPNWPSTWQLRTRLADTFFLRGPAFYGRAIQLYEEAVAGMLGERFQSRFSRQKLTGPVGRPILGKLSQCYLSHGVRELDQGRAAEALEVWSRPTRPWMEGASERLADIFPWSLTDPNNRWLSIELHRLWMLAAHIDPNLRDPQEALAGFERLADPNLGAGRKLQRGGASQTENRWAELFALDMRAAALAGLGRFDEAIQVSGQVIMQARQLGSAPLGWIEGVEQRNRVYRERKAYRFRSLVPLPSEMR